MLRDPDRRVLAVVLLLEVDEIAARVHDRDAECIPVSLGRFRDGAPFRPWLLTIVTNEARNRRRADTRRAGLALRATEDQRELAARSAEDEALERAGRADLLRAIERLRPADREVVSYRYLLGLDEAETAQALGCARGTVKSRLSRALERLRAELDPTPGGSRA